ncbi:MAG: hypothetical protein J0H71_10325 [Rhizobiales bacterium]|nr:hypothetical protein [Hyphomicrobiales bacterium]
MADFAGETPSRRPPHMTANRDCSLLSARHGLRETAIEAASPARVDEIANPPEISMKKMSAKRHLSKSLQAFRT